MYNKTGYRYAAIESGDIYFTATDEDLAFRFENEFTSLLGKIFLCSGTQEAYTKLQGLYSLRQWRSIFCSSAELQQALQLETLPIMNREGIDSSEAALTDCECLIARTGTIVLSAAQPFGRIIPIYRLHIVIAYSHQLVFDTKDAIDLLKNKYNNGLPSIHPCFS